MPLKIEFDKQMIAKYIKQSKEVVNDLQEIFVDTVAEELLAQAQENLRRGPTKAFDTGQLAERGGDVIKSRGTGTAIVGWGGPASDYVLSIEYGTEPGHRPPIAPLIAWARRVGIPNPDSVAWAIAKKIEKEGLPARPFMTNAVEEVRGRVSQIWEDVVRAYG